MNYAKRATNNIIPVSDSFLKWSAITVVYKSQ